MYCGQRASDIGTRKFLCSVRNSVKFPFNETVEIDGNGLCEYYEHIAILWGRGSDGKYAHEQSEANEI
jgi:hypothetical protein